MNQPDKFFAEFPVVSKEEWLAHISKDLKNKSLDDLYWHLNDEITVDPFGHADDWPATPAPLSDPAGVWKINEDVDDPDTGAAHRQAMEALTFGAGSLRFSLPNAQFSDTLRELLRGIYLDHISLHFGGQGLEEGPAALLAALKNLAQDQGISSRQLQGSLFYDPANGTGQIRDWRYLAELMQFAREEFPGFRTMTVNGQPDFKGPAGAADELASLLHKGRVYLDQLGVRGLSMAQISGQMQFSLLAGKSYFIEIAKLRAFKILWFNVLKAYSVEPLYPVTDVRFHPGDYTDDLYTNMIRATSMAMSAILGGSSRLTVLPYDAGREDRATYPRAFARRIARNVQHLLQLESSFGELSDPAAGSYYLEKLTAQLVSAAWEKLQKK